MKKQLFLGIALLVSIGMISVSCQKKEEGKAIHFGPNPGDGEAEGDENAKEEFLGSSPAEKKVEEGIHFGPSPTDG
ncbi:MAG: hypothetical protein H7A41_00970 [Chlamydiales bacterium]|nr:hypothetical protein [Chlamydiales bacterium]